MSQTSNFRRILALGFVTQFGSFWPPRVLQRCLLVSVIGGKWPQDASLSAPNKYITFMCTYSSSLY